MRPQPKLITCSHTGEKRWSDHKSVVRVLHDGHIFRTDSAEFGSESHCIEIRTYQCDACGGWHITRREFMVLSA